VVPQATLPNQNKQNTQLPTKNMVVGVQHVPLCPHALRSTSKNTNRYTRYCAVDMRAGGGRHGSHVVPQATLPNQINKTHNCPPKTWLSACSMCPCAHTHSALPRQIQTDTHTTALSIRERGKTGMGHVVRQATLPHETNDEKKQLPTHETVGDVQHAPLCSHRLRSTSTNTNRYTRCCAVDMETAGGAWVARSVTSHYHRRRPSLTK
jgi:hypothetical protein